jgi:hypothetical protein
MILLLSTWLLLASKNDVCIILANEGHTRPYNDMYCCIDMYVCECYVDICSQRF